MFLKFSLPEWIIKFTDANVQGHTDGHTDVNTDQVPLETT
jgi:hypothetical protein